MPKMPGIIRSAKFLKTGRKADIIDTTAGLVFNLPKEAMDPIDTIIVLEM